MQNISYINGRYVPTRYGVVNFQDRGYHFADGIYEVVSIYNGKLVDNTPHIKRLRRSLNELQIEFDYSDKAIEFICKNLIKKNRIKEGSVYLQITRGVANRGHAFPGEGVEAGFSVMCKHHLVIKPALIKKGVSVVTVKDMRWLRRDIKSISLLPNVMAKQQASVKNCFEAIFVDSKNNIVEGSSSNIFIIKDNELITYPSNNDILTGVTRNTIISLAKQLGFSIKEEEFSVQQMLEADEAFLTSTTNGPLSITTVDGKNIANGSVGRGYERLATAYEQYIKQAA